MCTLSMGSHSELFKIMLSKHFPYLLQLDRHGFCRHLVRKGHAYIHRCVHLFRKAREQLPVQEDGKYGEITTVRAKLGRDPSLPPEIETLVKMFIEHCEHIGVPHSRGRCAIDIQQMVIQERIPVP